MRNLASSFTMRKDRKLPGGDWFKIDNKADEDSPAIVYIYDEIGFWGTEASEFVQLLVALDANKIDLHLNSPGGEIFDGLAIYNALKQNKAEVTVYVDGLAASAASFIAQAGDKVIMARNAQMMIHDGIAMAYGNEQDMLDTAELLSKLSNNIADIYSQAASRRGFDDSYSEEYFRGLMRAELWMDGREAVEFGLADEVTDTDDEEADKAKNKWDLSFYNSAGREAAESPSRIAAKAMLSTKEKEKGMGNSPKNEGGNQPAEETGTPTGDPNEPGTTVQPDDSPEQPVTEPAQPSADPVVTPPENSATQQGVLIDGKMVTDWKVINQHFAAMQNAQIEARAVNRKEFIEGLAASNKIAASQIDQLVNLVNGDGQQVPAMSDQQFAAFQASYESAPASSLFGNHATTQSGQPAAPTGTPEANKADRKAVLEGTLAMHRRGGMSEERIKNTASYIELQTLLGSNES
jgi:ATP-dependent protease ClpP protease subunit